MYRIMTLSNYLELLIMTLSNYPELLIYDFVKLP